MNPEQIVRQATTKSSLQIWKLLLIGFLVLILMLPAAWIMSLVRERNQRKDSVVAEIAGKRGGAQLVSGPFISVPYEVLEKSRDQYGKEISVSATKYLHLAPDSLKINGNVQGETHQRGIYEVSGYKSGLRLRAVFLSAGSPDPIYQNLPLRWNEALVSFDLSDQRGMKDLQADLNGQALLFNRSEGVLTVSGVPTAEATKGIPERPKFAPEEVKDTAFQLAARVPESIQGKDLALELQMHLTGTQRLSFTASALQEDVYLTGDWLAPSFIGDALPEIRSVTDSGFDAAWRTNKLSSGVKKAWTSDEPLPQLSQLGVDFLITADSYQQTTRALKYSVMFLLLTFMTFWLAEIKTRQRIHPIQYLMVGCALLVFYLLLLSISEHLAFAWAYLIAAVAAILQISLFCFSILKSRKFAVQVGILLSFLYAFLYVLLQLQDSALLVGSVSLFVLLSVAMYIIRNINWYSQD